MQCIPAILMLCLISLQADAPADQKNNPVTGKVLLSDGRPLSDITPVMFLRGAVTPFAAKALAAADGQFRFKDIPDGTYVLIAVLPRIGETRKTMVVGPSFADSNGRVTVRFAGEETVSPP